MNRTAGSPSRRFPTCATRARSRRTSSDGRGRSDPAAAGRRRPCRPARRARRRDAFGGVRILAPKTDAGRRAAARAGHRRTLRLLGCGLRPRRRPAVAFAHDLRTRSCGRSSPERRSTAPSRSSTTNPITTNNPCSPTVPPSPSSPPRSSRVWGWKASCAASSRYGRGGGLRPFRAFRSRPPRPLFSTTSSPRRPSSNTTPSSSNGGTRASLLTDGAPQSTLRELHCLDIAQSEEGLVRDILRLHQHAHREGLSRRDGRRISGHAPDASLRTTCLRPARPHDGRDSAAIPHAARNRRIAARRGGAAQQADRPTARRRPDDGHLPPPQPRPQARHPLRGRTDDLRRDQRVRRRRATGRTVKGHVRTTAIAGIRAAPRAARAAASAAGGLPRLPPQVVRHASTSAVFFFSLQMRIAGTEIMSLLCREIQCDDSDTVPPPFLRMPPALRRRAMRTPKPRRTVRTHDEAPEAIDTAVVMDNVQVTAIKQGLTLRNRPVAASVVGRETIERRGVTAIKELSQLVPNFHIPDYGSRMTSSVYVRGLGARIDQPVMGLNVEQRPLPLEGRLRLRPGGHRTHRGAARPAEHALRPATPWGGVMNIYTLSPLAYEGTRLGAEYARATRCGCAPRPTTAPRPARVSRWRRGSCTATAFSPTNTRDAPATGSVRAGTDAASIPPRRAVEHRQHPSRSGCFGREATPMPRP